MGKLDGLLEGIARKSLQVSTLKTQNSDGLDFHDVAVWQIKKALEEAYRAGQADPTGQK